MKTSLPAKKKAASRKTTAASPGRPRKPVELVFDYSDEEIELFRAVSAGFARMTLEAEAEREAKG